ncbi:MAG: MgtC/SapB family protein [Candidatus Aenigmarchaeota archaeon]|nr:MgtC/SapB family protein [Candidatus Aenigmarchaeota archaeon]
MNGIFLLINTSNSITINSCTNSNRHRVFRCRINIEEGNKVKNLTTAASVWFAAAIGMCYGFGYYFMGIVCTFVSFIVPKIPHFKPQNSD